MALGTVEKAIRWTVYIAGQVTRLLPVFTLDLCPAVPFPRFHAKIQKEIIL